MVRSISFIQAITAIVCLGVAHACYYYYYIEDPNSFAYRYCSVGCGEAVLPGEAEYEKCCIPLSSGAPTPSTCTALASSASAAGTRCSWSAVPTTDMSPAMSKSMELPFTSKINARPTSGAHCETKWVTTTVPASDRSAAAWAPTGPSSSPITSSSSPSTTIKQLPTLSYSTSRIKSLPTSSDISLEISAPPLSAETNPSTASKLKVPPTQASFSSPTVTSLSVGSNPTSMTASASTGSSSSSNYTDSTLVPTCSCDIRPEGAGSTPPPGWRKRSDGISDSCQCEDRGMRVADNKSAMCPCPHTMPEGAGSTPPESFGRRGEDALCPCPSSTPINDAKPEASAAWEPQATCDCQQESRPEGAGSTPGENWHRRELGDGQCQCPPVPCECTRTEGAGAAPPSGWVKRDGTCTCATASQDTDMEDFSADSRRRKRALPPADGSDVPPTPDPNAVGDALSLSNVNALPTFYPSSSTLPVEIGASSHCTTTMTTTITPGCSPTASSGSRNDSGSPRADDYNDIEDCDEEMDTSPLRVGETPPTANNQEPIEVEGTELADETISRYSISSSVAPTPSDVSEMAQLASTPSLTGVSGAHDTTIANPQEVDPMKIDFE